MPAHPKCAEMHHQYCKPFPKPKGRITGCPVTGEKLHLTSLQSIDSGGQGDLIQRTTERQNFGIFGPQEQITCGIREGFLLSHSL